MKQWFKFYGQEFLTDPKMLSLNVIERSLWITILCLANNTEDGVIKYITEQKIMMLSGIDVTENYWSESEGFLDKFQELGMITHDNTMITVTHFTKRQNEYLSSYERVKRFREKHKIEAKNDNKVKRYLDNARLDKTRLDKNKEESIKKKPSLEDLTEEIICRISQDYHLPMAFVSSKADDLKNWCASHGKTYKDYPAALRNWVKRDAEKIVQAQHLPNKSFDATTGGAYELTS
jgi:hypothetical protein